MTYEAFQKATALRIKMNEFVEFIQRVEKSETRIVSNSYAISIPDELEAEYNASMQMFHNDYLKLLNNQFAELSKQFEAL